MGRRERTGSIKSLFFVRGGAFDACYRHVRVSRARLRKPFVAKPPRISQNLKAAHCFCCVQAKACAPRKSTSACPPMANSFESFVASLFFLGARGSVDVRLIDGVGSLSNAGLLQVKTESGFGSVCGANPAAADVICRSLGYMHGSVSSSSCRFYGGADLCGATGAPVVSANSTN